jgi:RNA polymerase subunit RPABC4/transcription elongation factor Spt4
MKICPDCKRSIDNDSVFCGYCGMKLPYGLEEGKDEEETGGDDGTENNEAALAVWSCENCGEQLEESFDTCWKCGTVRIKDAESPAAGAAEDSAGPLLAVCGMDKRLEVYGDKVLIAPSGAPGAFGQAAYVAPCEIFIKNIISIEFTSAKDSVAGFMVVNYAAVSPDGTAEVVNMSEPVLFDAGAEQEMEKAMALIKRCRADLDAQADNDDR